MKDVPRKRNVAKTSRTIVIMPDVQAPLHDEKLVDKFVQFLADYEPDELAQVGDFTDSTEISRWVRGKKGEFAGDLQFGLNSGKRILEKIRDVTDVRFRIVRSNHDDRLELYIAGCAPGLEGLDALTIENLAGFNEFDVEFIRDEVVELTPEARDPWIMCHGDEGSLNSIAGRTAFNLAKNKFGANVVCGHTHRAGLTSESYGYNGQIRDTRHGMEVGHFMDLTKADYLKKKGVAANWQQSFGILHVHGSKVYPQLVTVDYDGNFSVEGKLY
jgi:predicted phosphodiesterase